MGRNIFFTAALSITFVAIVYGNCPEGWHNYHAGKRCFFLSNDNETFAGAYAMCNLLGKMAGREAYVATVNDAATQTYINGLMAQTSIQSYFIGLIDIQKEGHWVWSHTGETATYLNWGTGQPNNRDGIERCTLMNNVPEFGFVFTWTDDPCSSQFPFICEMSSVGALTGSALG